MTYQILYNPLAGNGFGLTRVQELKSVLTDGEVVLCDIREIGDIKSFLNEFSKEDVLILSGGDGTINRFVNDTDGANYPEQLYYYPTGSGNDFLRDAPPDERGLVKLNRYIKDLPVVTVKNKTYRFLNGIGYGIDGYCCEVGDELRRKSDKPINYTSIAIKGLLFYYKPTHATVTVDGQTYEFDKVWLAPTMNGRHYGGGMMIAPEQDRLNSERELTLVVLHGSGKLKTLCVFPSIFKGEHIKHKDIFTLLRGKSVCVKFDRPVALQIDGETVLDVSEYTVQAAVPAKEKAQV